MDQNQQPMVCKTHTTTYITIFVIALALGIFIGSQFLKTKASPEITGNNTYEAGWNAAKARVAQFGFPPNLQNAEIRNVFGAVQAVSGATFTVKIHPVEPLADPKLDIRTVMTDVNTKFYIIKQKDQKTIQAETAIFIKKMSQGGSKISTGITPPEPFTRTPATIADITVGTNITAVAATNIREVASFTATEIIISPTVK